MLRKQSVTTVELTRAQASTLGMLPAHRIWQQLDNGAVIASFIRLEAARMVVDIHGDVHGFDRYMAALSGHA